MIKLGALPAWPRMVAVPLRSLIFGAVLFVLFCAESYAEAVRTFQAPVQASGPSWRSAGTATALIERMEAQRFVSGNRKESAVLRLNTLRLSGGRSGIVNEQTARCGLDPFFRSYPLFKTISRTTTHTFAFHRTILLIILRHADANLMALHFVHRFIRFAAFGLQIWGWFQGHSKQLTVLSPVCFLLCHTFSFNLKLMLSDLQLELHGHSDASRH